MPAAGEIYNPFRIFRGSFIPNSVLRCRELSATSKLVFGRLCQYSGENGQVFPSYNTLGNEVGVGRRQTIRAVRELEDFGLIRAIPRQRSDRSPSSNAYVFLWHRIFFDEAFSSPSVKNDTRGSDTKDTTQQCHSRHQIVSGMTPKENQSRDENFEKTTTGKVHLLLSGTPLSKISVQELQRLEKRHGLEKLSQAADIAAETWRRNRQEKYNPGGYLNSLCSSLMLPDWYVPLSERTALAQALHERKTSIEVKKKAQKAHEEKQDSAKNVLWESLSEDQRAEFRSAAHAGLPAGFLPSMAVIAMAKQLAWEEKQSSTHD